MKKLLLTLAMVLMPLMLQAQNVCLFNSGVHPTIRIYDLKLNVDWNQTVMITNAQYQSSANAKAYVGRHLLNIVNCFTSTPTPTQTCNISSTPICQNQYTVTPTPTWTHTFTNTLTNTATLTTTNTATKTPTNSPTNTPTNSPTITPTNTPSNTPTKTPTCDISSTPICANQFTNTPTKTPTPSPTKTPTNSPTNTPTLTPTITPAPNQNVCVQCNVRPALKIYDLNITLTYLQIATLTNIQYKSSKDVQSYISRGLLVVVHCP